MVKLKQAEKNDIPFILGCMKDYYKIEGIKFDEVKSGTTLESLLSAKNIGSLSLIYSDDQPAGYFFLAFSFTLEYYGRDCFLDEIYIKPEFRNIGVGTKVMRLIEEYLKQIGFKAIHLIVYNKNHNAFKYYIKNRFKKHEAHFMTKVLNKNI